MASTIEPASQPHVNMTLYEHVINGALNTTTTITTTTGTSVLPYVSDSNDTTSVDVGHPPVLMTLPLGVQVVAFTVMVGVCSVLGTVGNIPVLLVYCTRSERRTANTFIKALAVIDLVVCAVIMPYSVVMELHLVSSDIVCKLFEFVRHAVIGASNLTVVAIAVERYVAVCQIEHRITVSNVQQGMVIVAVISVLIAAPSLGIFAAVTQDMVTDVKCAYPHDFSPNASFCHFTTALLGPALSATYQTSIMVFFFLTFMVIVVLYAIVFWSLWKRSQVSLALKSSTLDMEVSSSCDRRRARESSLPRDTEAEEKHSLKPNTAGSVTGLAKLNESSGLEEDQLCRLDASTDLNGSANSNVGSSSAATYTSVRQVSKRRNTMHRRTARMLFLCSVVFLLTWLPFWVDVFSNTHNLCLRYLFFLGNASNPLVYGIANSHFRGALLKLLEKLRPRCGHCHTAER